MNTKFILWGIIFAGLAVILGAFGAHILDPHIHNPKYHETFRTGVSYQFYHAFALILTGILFRHKSNRQMRNAGYLFGMGIILFSGSLYLLTLGDIVQRDYSFAGPLTPLGGVCFIIGWVLLGMNFTRHKSMGL